MNDRHADAARRVAEAVLQSPGAAERGLRGSVEGRAAALAGRGAAAGVGLPAALALYVEKVARHAYLVTDADVAALRDAGYSEEAIFEITLSAALGAGMARLERGFAALGDD